MKRHLFAITAERFGFFRTVCLNQFDYLPKAIFRLATNALLRCEQRNTEAPAYHLKH